MRHFLPTEETKQRIISSGCFREERNIEVFNKWFARGPRGRIQTLITRFGLDKKLVADIGCGYGNNLIYFGEGSYGLELLTNSAEFARSIGLHVYTKDFVADDISELAKVDVAFCYAVIEHVESPHVALRRLHTLLRPNGIVIVYVPTLPSIPLLNRLPVIGRHFQGHLHGDHVNAFTPETIRFMVERAGFAHVETTCALSGVGGIFDVRPLRGLIDGIAIVGRKIDGWEYPGGSLRRATENGKGFIYR